jgi:hypothetical protein
MPKYDDDAGVVDEDVEPPPMSSPAPKVVVEAVDKSKNNTPKVKTRFKQKTHSGSDTPVRSSCVNILSLFKLAFLYSNLLFDSGRIR